MLDIARMDMQAKLREVIRRTQSRVGPAVAQQLEALIAPQNLAIIAGVLVAWAGSHASASAKRSISCSPW